MYGAADVLIMSSPTRATDRPDYHRPAPARYELALHLAGAGDVISHLRVGKSSAMPFDHSHAPVLDALARYHSSKQLSFSPPGHKQARGADPRVRDVLGDAVFYGDVLASGGLDDRRTGGRILERAEKLMADAVHASHTFSPRRCGSSRPACRAMPSSGPWKTFPCRRPWVAWPPR
jgi:hypothetical protein